MACTFRALKMGVYYTIMLSFHSLLYYRAVNSGSLGNDHHFLTPWLLRTGSVLLVLALSQNLHIVHVKLGLILHVSTMYSPLLLYL